MGKTAIGWTEFSVNPIRARLVGSGKTAGGYASGVGHYCEKVSQGCKHCYSSELQPKFGLPVFQEQRGGAVESFFDASKLKEVLRRKKPTKFFWCDMTDLFGEWVPFEWIAACFGVMAATPHHTHQVLTKRPERALEFFSLVEKRGGDGAQMFPDEPREWLIHQFMNVSARRVGADVPSHHGGEWPLPGVHLGVSVEDQRRADERIPILLRLPAAIRWVSFEPLLGEIAGGSFIRPSKYARGYHQAGGDAGVVPSHLRAPGIDWAVVGGESGAGHRPVDPAWIESIVQQCTEADVPAYVKQDSGPKPGKQGRLSAEVWARKEFPR